jgi:cysteine synthase
MMGVAKFLVEKEAALRLEFADPRESFLINGKFTLVENVMDKKEMLALEMVFNENLVPMGYKMRLNDFMVTVRADNRMLSGGDEAKTD